jgi:hypothetical protein
MNESDSIRLAGILAITGHDWTDAHIEAYAQHFRAWSDLAAAEAAVARCIKSWRQAKRIPLGMLEDEYQREAARNEMLRPRVGSGERVVPFSEGIQIAWRAYVAEAHRTGRKPNRELFGRWSALLRDSLPKD